MLKQLAPAFRLVLLMTVVTGLIYPGIVTGFCQMLFRSQADGSLRTKGNQIIGSALLAQNFTKPEYFHPRPSAAGNDGYDATASSGSNLGPTSQKLMDRLKASSDQFHKENPSYTGSIPADAITASGSGLDPDISIANAEAQMARVAEARGTNAQEVGKLVSAATVGRDWGFLGEPHINVLKLNLELDRRFAKR